ncbi:MAG: M23 family metallopeptidase [candidate division WOR-3 bacterium]|nr:MAG: M23 family metallopeptidase [candidate division WOR-3 bacterium]
MQKRRSLSRCSFTATCLAAACVLGSLFLHAQQTPAQEDSLDAQQKQVKPFTETDVSLDRRIDRDRKTIDFTYPYETTLEPADIHVGDRRHMEETGNASTISLTGILQRINLDKDTYRQGEIARLHITAVAPLERAEITFLWRTYDLYPVDTTATMYTTVLGVPMTADTGQYTMTLKYQDGDEYKSLQLPFRVIAGSFSEEDTAELDIHILTEETLEMLKFEGSYFARAYGVSPEVVMYTGDFIWPCPGRITGLFGTPRKYNQDMDEWSHKAVDIANAVGTKVYAANSGVIALAKNLDVHGKSIVIAHGGGIHSVYLHLDSLYVEKNDKVKKGQLIGRLGKTGLCTGPNCHFGIVVNRVHTDPRYWMEDQPELKKGLWVESQLTKK